MTEWRTRGPFSIRKRHFLMLYIARVSQTLVREGNLAFIKHKKYLYKLYTKK